jgi:fructose-bisphosphate aldolase / 2-amino-3,7-dideoxy-D-threo-hept-6-ulosonate synthase
MIECTDNGRVGAVTGLGAGKARRLRRIVDPLDGCSALLPLDGVLVVGCMTGGEDLAPLLQFAEGGAPDAVMLRYGEARRLGAHLPAQVGLIVRLSGAGEDGPDPNFEPLLSSVEAAAAIGADAVCATLKLGSAAEHEMLQGIGSVAEACDRHGLVFLCEAFALDADGNLQTSGERPARAARIAQELGADLVKIANPDDPDEMRALAAWCQIPIVVAGGARTSPTAVVYAVTAALDGGAAGVAIGRNVIEHPEPALMQSVLSALVHRRLSPAEAIAKLESTAVPL